VDVIVCYVHSYFCSKELKKMLAMFNFTCLLPCIKASLQEIFKEEKIGELFKSWLMEKNDSCHQTNILE